MRDLYHNIAPVPALAPAVQAAAVDGVAIDTLEAIRIAFIVSTGAIGGDGDFGLKLQDSDESGSGFADVAAEFVDSNAPATLEASSSYKLGYRGHKQFVRVVLTKAGGTSIVAGAVAIVVPTIRPA